MLGVLEVGGVDVAFVGGEGLDELLLKGEGGDGAAGEVVVEAAVLHGGPVADGGEVDGGGGAIALDELLDGLGGVEEACGGGGGEGEGVGAGGDGVAFGGHLRRERGGAGELEGEGSGGGDGAGGERGFEVLAGEGVVGVGGAGRAGDADALGYGLAGTGLDLARSGDEGQGL